MTVPVLQAMAAVRWLEGRVPNRPKLEEVTPEKAALTDADCVAQEILLVAVHEAFPGVGLCVEEDTPSVGRFGATSVAHTVVIDPIDGTLRYLRRDGPYAILVGLEVEERVVASIVGLPQSGTIVRAVRGEGAEIARVGEPFRAATPVGAGRTLYVSYGLPEDVRGRLEGEGYKLVTAAGGAIGVAPLLEEASAGLRISAIPSGISRRAWVATLPTLEAGAAVELLDGAFPERYREGVPGMIVARSPEEISALRALIG
jgi:hypothetical protein